MNVYSNVLFFALGSLTLIAGCGRHSNAVIVQGAVLKPGTTVEATNKNGFVRISYVDTTRRKYTWDKRSETIRLIARKEPFRGELGLYEPAASWGLNPWETRLVLDESVRDFESEQQLQNALVEGSAVMDWVYTNDGLVVGFGRIPARKQINIELFQFLLRGKKPRVIAGAHPNQIQLTGAK